jgi:hypothetical protein
MHMTRSARFGVGHGISLLLLSSAVLLGVAGCGGDDGDSSNAGGDSGGAGNDATGGDGSGTGGAPAEGTGGAPMDGTGGDGAVSCGSPGRSGTTTCLASPNAQCPAGQYCDSEMLTCSVGCTSDENCPADEECVRGSGEAVGTCTACPRCGDGACSAGETAESCPADCDVSNSNVGLDDCLETCDGFDFFCDDVDGDTCASACVGATAEKRGAFVECANTLNCSSYACVSMLE